MTSENMSEKDWYSILGAHPSDSQAELKQKYQKLALLYHPDKQHRDISEQDKEGARKFIEISQAWKMLGNEETKRAYDLQRRGEEHFSFSCRCGGQYIAVESDLQQTTFINCDSCSLVIEILQGSQT
ncbi:dnaJ homolog subfamily C member 24 isoform X2 [Dendrobates tinctorius]|uniref:dnaJ homolog subfamily C member 24 isoform X2 n=1 Tax=Dendrobates tinctorius TaxID=92724 RepID=UPI003CCA4304